MKAISSRFPLLHAVGIITVCAAMAHCCVATAHDTAELLKAATSGEGAERHAAIDDLGEHHDHGIDAAQAVTQLEKLLSDADAQVRWRSARALSDFDEAAKSAAPKLRELLSDADSVVKYHAAVALGHIHDDSDETIRALVKAAASEDARVSRAAVGAIRHLEPGPKKVAAALAEVLKSDDQAVQLFALEAITELGAEAAPLLKEALQHPETAYLACTAIEHIGPDAKDTVPALTKLIGETKHSHLLIQAMLAVASIGPDAVPAESTIIPQLEHSTDATVPVAAAYALGSIGAVKADAPLRAAMAKNNAFLQMVAAWALAKIHPDDDTLEKQAVDKLIEGLRSNDAHIRNAAAKGLQSLKASPELVAPQLMKVANDPNPEVSANAANALASLGESIVPKATNALQNPEQRNFAVRVLTQMGAKASGAVDELVKVMSDPDPDFRAHVHFALAAIGSAAAPATDNLAEAIFDEDERVRESALYALRSIGTAAGGARDALVKRMNADESFASLASAWALAKVAPEDSQVAEAAIPKLVKGLSAEDEVTQLNSVEALAAWKGNAQAASALEQAAKENSSEQVRAAAEAALAGAAK